ncbi:hypothetical protein PanWU01x14_042770 [Parasponia andersonii]|uniref:Uncharacterized protein n=1 Tax=Parasponia andersonii TaxID=3476 RepID=A0A2P5DPV2_PARAD|nr:hypothetical protein PanWU01x14_042770 [Parasponia andersonii]
MARMLSRRMMIDGGYNLNNIQIKKALDLLVEVIDNAGYLGIDMTSMNAWSADPIQVPIGPLIRAHAKRLKNALSGLIQDIIAQACTWRPIDGDERISKPITSLIQVQES